MSNWKEEYDKLILSGDLKGAKKLCKRSIDHDKKIYKFFKGTNRNLESVRANTLWLSRGGFFNDPFDASFFVNCKSQDVYREDEREIAIKEYFEQKEQDKISFEMQHNSLITSFSEKPNSILMWSYYAKDHKGFCVEYSLKKLMKEQLVLPVVYSDKMLQITEYTEDNRIIGMLVKAKCWEHEKEWRMIRLAGDHTDENGEIVENIPSPTAFYFGNRIWNNEKDNYESKYKCKKMCTENNKECKLTFELPYKDRAVDIEQIKEYTKGKMPLFGYELSRKEFKLERVKLIH